MAEAHHRKVRSFVRRPGRTTTAQRRALDTLWPRYGLGDDGPIDLPAVFGRTAPVVVEIGFGDGEALFTSAVNHPEIDHLGIEVHEPGIGHLLVLLERAGLANVRLVARDAVEVLGTRLAPSSIDVVRIFFPDPWPKKRHHKRRLVQRPFVDVLAHVLKPGGGLHFATDWVGYAEHIEAVMADCVAFREIPAPEAASDPALSRPSTKFERRGRRKGHEVRDLRYRRL